MARNDRECAGAADDAADHEERPEREDAAGAADGDQYAEPDDSRDPDRCCGAADGPATAVRDPAEERYAHGRTDVRGCDGVEAAADRVAGRRVDERQRRAARAERGAPGERATDARAREQDAGGPEEPWICGTEAVDRRADAVAEKGGGEAEDGQKGQGEPCHCHMSFRQVILHGSRTTVLGTRQPLLESRHRNEIRTGRPVEAQAAARRTEAGCERALM